MNKWKESELVRSLLGFFLLFLLFVGLFIFVVPSTHQSSKIAEKIKSIKNEKVTYVAYAEKPYMIAVLIASLVLSFTFIFTGFNFKKKDK